MEEIYSKPRYVAVFLGQRRSGPLFGKKEKEHFKYGLGECVYQIPGNIVFGLVKGCDTNIHTKPYEWTQNIPTACSPPLDYGMIFFI